ncbi:MAG: toxin-antitoxin system YwqK family antitoxin [Bacteroidales bacterium]
MKNSTLLILILIIAASFGHDGAVYGQAQSDSSTFKRFYYTNGRVSSEGNIINGQPDGYWKTYQENGKIKSEGNRKNFELDSLWKFYDENGKIILDLEYKKGKKNGLKRTYGEGETIAETFINDIKQGPTTYFHPDGKVKKIVPFVNGLESGISREFDKEGNVITIFEYKKGYLVSREYINRRDKEGLQQGKWVTFWDNGNIHTEGSYRGGKKNGYFREYTPDGKLFKMFKYIDDELQADAEEIAKIDERADYYSNGKLKVMAQYKNNLPDGLWREYTEEGKLDKGFLYKKGIIIGKGITDEAGFRQGPWIEYYDDGILKAEGKYKNGKKTGYWKYYYHSGVLEEEGGYDNQGRPDGDWKWYHENKALLKEASYSLGKEDGLMTEYNEAGEVVARGEYVEGLEQGKWLYSYGDHKEEGNYQNGQRDGNWIYYYGDGTKEFEGKFVEDLPDGRHIYYWENGNKKDEGIYVMGKKEGDWIKYNPDGTPFLIVTYKNGSERRYDGVKIMPELNEGE